MKNNIILLLLMAISLSATTLKVGIYQNSPKVSYNDKGTPEGIFVDVLNEIAIKEGWELTYIPGIWQDQLKALEEGKIDVLLDVFASPERMQKFKFNKISLVDSWLEVYACNDFVISSILELNGKRVAVLKGSMQETYLANELKPLLNINFTLLTYPDYQASQQAVLKGEADLLVASRFFFFSADRNPKIDTKHIIFSPSGTHIAFKKEIDQAVIEKIDNHISKMKNTPHSVFYHSLEFWLSGDRNYFFMTYFYPVLAVLICLIVILFAFSLLLKKKVKTKTAELVKSETHIKAMLEINPDLIFILDQNGNYQDCHTSSSVLLYLPWQQMSGKNVRDVLPKEVAELLLDKIRQVLADRQLQTIEYSLIINKLQYYFEARIIAFEDRNIMIIARDISEKKNLENKLRLSQKMEAIGVLAAGIAHEINSPVQYIMDNTLFIKDNIGKILEQLVKPLNNGEDQNLDYQFVQEEIPRSIEGTLDGVARIQKIVASLKDFSYPREYLLLDTNINQALETVITITTGSWKNRAEIVKNFDWNLPLVPCFSDKLNQVFINLIVNAVDAIKESGERHGKIEISTKAMDGYVSISFKDNGQGIPEHLKEKVFEPFFTTKEVGKGTGQGLSIVYDIITDLHQGSIELISEVGKGTEFVIKLPLTEGANHA